MELAAVGLEAFGEWFHVVPVFDDPAVLDAEQVEHCEFLSEEYPAGGHDEVALPDDLEHVAVDHVFSGTCHELPEHLDAAGASHVTLIVTG